MKQFAYFFFFLQCERLKKLHAELEEKLEASEIQNKQQSAEYRTLLQQKGVRALASVWIGTIFSFSEGWMTLPGNSNNNKLIK